MVRCPICGKNLSTTYGYRKHVDNCRLDKSIRDSDKILKDIKRIGDTMNKIKIMCEKCKGYCFVNYSFGKLIDEGMVCSCGGKLKIIDGGENK